MRPLLLLLMLSSIAFGQDVQKGTITAKKKEQPASELTTIVTFDTLSRAGFGTMWVNYGRPKSYGKEYTRAPEFKGGWKLQKLFTDTTKVVPDCYKCKGSTVVSDYTALINEDGTLSEITLKHGAQDCPQCDQEALRVIRLMPAWWPAELNGKDIALKWDVSVSFTYLK